MKSISQRLENQHCQKALILVKFGSISPSFMQGKPQKVKNIKAVILSKFRQLVLVILWALTMPHFPLKLALGKSNKVLFIHDLCIMSIHRNKTESFSECPEMYANKKAQFNVSTPVMS